MIFVVHFLVEEVCELPKSDSHVTNHLTSDIWTKFR